MECNLHLFCTYFAPLHYIVIKHIINDMKQTIFTAEASYLPAINCSDNEIEQRNLARLLLSDQWRDLVQAIRDEADTERQKQLKQRLPAFMPSGVFSKKAAGGLQQHSGFICIDIDGKDNKEVENFADLKALVRLIPHVEYCGLSVSGTGYFCIIPVADPAKHRDYFRAIAHDFRRCGIVIDRKCINVNRLRFVSYDPSPYVNTGALVYNYVLPAVEANSHKSVNVFKRQLSDVEANEYFTAILKEIEAWHIDITGDYIQWFDILCAIASTYGEDGRDIAHAISSKAECYDYEETEKQYSECVKHSGYDYTIGTFFYYAKRELGAHYFDNITDDTI